MNANKTLTAYSYCTMFIFSLKSSKSRVTCLLLSFWNLFNEDPGHGRPACVCVSKLMATGTLSNPESHSNLSFVDVIPLTFNMAVTMKTVVLASLHVERTFNGARKAALDAIEGEIRRLQQPSHP